MISFLAWKPSHGFMWAMLLNWWASVWSTRNFLWLFLALMVDVYHENPFCLKHTSLQVQAVKHTMVTLWFMLSWAAGTEFSSPHLDCLLGHLGIGSPFSMVQSLFQALLGGGWVQGVYNISPTMGNHDIEPVWLNSDQLLYLLNNNFIWSFWGRRDILSQSYFNSFVFHVFLQILIKTITQWREGSF